MAISYASVVKILTAESNSLKDLAMISGRDIFSFFRGASLKNLDLTDQDLRGLNFENSDIRFSKLEGALFDKGAFNRSLIDSSQSWVCDEYDSYVEELRSHTSHAILIFCKLRPGLIDDLLDRVQMPYTVFSEKYVVGVNALRKARNGGIIAHATAINVLGGFEEIAGLIKAEDPTFAANLKQPCLRFMYGGNNKPFTGITFKRLAELAAFKDIIDEQRRLRRPTLQVYRDTVEYLESLLSRYEDTLTTYHASDIIPTEAEMTSV